jgi:regulator of RNase E activity RraA
MFNKIYSALCGALMLNSANEKEWFWVVVFGVIILLIAFTNND